MNDTTQTITAWLGTGSINIFGRPFAGKDTQGEKLAELFNAELIAGGDILRSRTDQTGVQTAMATGGLINSNDYYNLVLPYLQREDFKVKPLILSSVGRMRGEETVIMDATAASGHPMKAVVLLRLSEEDAWRRFDEAQQNDDRGDRRDDDREVLQNRLNKFRDETMPVVEYYRERGLVIEVDGTLSREAVTQEILDALAARASA